MVACSLYKFLEKEISFQLSQRLSLSMFLLVSSGFQICETSGNDINKMLDY